MKPPQEESLAETTDFSQGSEYWSAKLLLSLLHRELWSAVPVLVKIPFFFYQTVSRLKTEAVCTVLLWTSLLSYIRYHIMCMIINVWSYTWYDIICSNNKLIHFLLISTDCDCELRSSGQTWPTCHQWHRARGWPRHHSHLQQHAINHWHWWRPGDSACKSIEFKIIMLF